MIKISAYTFTYLNDDSQSSERQLDIDTVRKMRKGDSFEFFKKKFVLEENLVDEDGKVTVTNEELKKLFIDYNYMDAVIKKLVAYCPDLEVVKTRNSKKREFIKNSLNEVEWSLILNEIYDGMEESGDMYLEIYFEDYEDTIPKLRVLDSSNMQRAMMDDKNRYKQYIYKERVEDDTASYTTGDISTTNTRDRVIVFEKGRKVIFDPIMKDGNTVIDDLGNVSYNVKTIENRDSYINDFPLIHIKGYKKQRDEFSEIPASKYIDLCLVIISNLSSLHQTNNNLGFPILGIVDGSLVAGSRRTSAGFLGIQTTDRALEQGKQGQLIDVQITNKLDSMFREFEIARDELFSKVGLITPTLLEKLNIDSSRVIQQLNLPSENKIELYVDNTIKAMQLWFKILLKENNMYSERTDKNLSFMKPKFLIKSSPFDELLYEQSEIKSTKKSRKEIYIENGMTDEEIRLKEKEINEELGDDTKDKSFAKNEVTDRVANGQNVDNNMINK